jgi:hypothetical protein
MKTVKHVGNLTSHRRMMAAHREAAAKKAEERAKLVALLSGKTCTVPGCDWHPRALQPVSAQVGENIAFSDGNVPLCRRHATGAKANWGFRPVGVALKFWLTTTKAKVKTFANFLICAKKGKELRAQLLS